MPKPMKPEEKRAMWWMAGAFAAGILLFLPHPWGWSAVVGLGLCGLQMIRWSRKADKTFGYPMSPLTRETLDAKLDQELRDFERCHGRPFGGLLMNPDECQPLSEIDRSLLRQQGVLGRRIRELRAENERLREELDTALRLLRNPQVAAKLSQIDPEDAVELFLEDR